MLFKSLVGSTVFMILVSIILVLLGIWTGDIRFAETAAVAFMVSIFCGVSLIFTPGPDGN